MLKQITIEKFREKISHEDFYFSGYEFDFDVEISEFAYNGNNNIATRWINFSYSVFNKNVNLSNCISHEYIDFSDSVFNSNVNFSDSVFNKDIYFNGAKFHNLVDFKNTVFFKNADFKYAEFYGKTDFSDSKFKGKVRFHKANFFGYIIFDNTTFEDLVDFYTAQFHSTHSFCLTDFLGVAIFSNVIFHEQVQFVYNKVKAETIISFENTEFKQSLDISRSNFWCKLQFWGIKIDKPIPSNLWLYEFDKAKEKKVKRINNAYKNLRETYRIIKHTFREEGNNIEALKFNQKELFVFKAERGINLKSIFKFNCKYKILFRNLKQFDKNEYWSKIKYIYKKTTKYFQRKEENIIIFFNYISNNFGQSWLRGLFFTLIFTAIFFSLFINLSKIILEFNFTWDSFCETTEYFIQFLNLTNWNYHPFKIGINNEYHLGYIILFIGRIFIGYGYYQIISAFRKYGKN